LQGASVFFCFHFVVRPHDRARRSNETIARAKRPPLQLSKGDPVIVERLLGSLIGTTFGLRGKPHGRAHGFLTGGPSSFLNTSTLLTAAGLAATAYTLYRAHQTATPVSSSTVRGGPLPPEPPAASGGALPPAPSRPSAPPPLAPPAMPEAHELSSPSRNPIAPSAGTAPVDALTRLVALSIAAARCDGDLGEEEYGRLIQVAREHKAESLVSRELFQSRPLSDLAAGVTDPKERSDLYVLAYSIVRADESVSPAERAWLAQWAGLLGLDSATTARLEKDAAQRIASAPPARADASS
jgi:uncharacterized membrane protein YebE (DUF533 family)